MPALQPATVYETYSAIHDNACSTLMRRTLPLGGPKQSILQRERQDVMKLGACTPTGTCGWTVYHHSYTAAYARAQYQILQFQCRSHVTPPSSVGLELALSVKAMGAVCGGCQAASS